MIEKMVWGLGRQRKRQNFLCFVFALAISTTLLTKLAFAHPNLPELLAETDLLLQAVGFSSDFLYFLSSRAECCPALSLACIKAYCNVLEIQDCLSSCRYRQDMGFVSEWALRGSLYGVAATEVQNSHVRLCQLFSAIYQSLGPGLSTISYLWLSSVQQKLPWVTCGLYTSCHAAHFYSTCLTSNRMLRLTSS